ncbi:hypothetical protein OKC48_02810 [Methylorubrum extorquens]|uniref:hypothetical protein n=1 Tax=Methylorubrum extorquens TaxID=408 RepID=UPI002238AE1A|nr:hypothetical protein [Methylorubrum extorquens]UYW27485.1 hypothetical protein OKC48_02810 [Methylorubrum extorquens]
MRVPTAQTVIFATDWISDPWVAKGIESAGVLPMAAPMYDPPEEVDAWPDFHVSTTFSTLPLPVSPTRHGTVVDLIAAARVGGGDDGEDATREFLASQTRITSHGDAYMIFGDQVRSWVLASVGSLLRGLVFAPPGTDEDVIASQAVARVSAPLRFSLPDTWGASNRFGDRHLELLLNLTLDADGSFAPLDPTDLRIGQGIPWQQSWRWLSREAPTALVLEALCLAARLLRNRGLLRGLNHALTASGPEVRTLATGVLRRWVLTLKAMAWAEHALGQSWDVVRPADIACFAFSSVKPEWPRRLLAISHRSFEVKPNLRHMGVWKSVRCAIDATYLPSWETNTGMIWGLFAATPVLVRVKTPAYAASVWCRREAEMIEHLCNRADYLTVRHVMDAELDQLPVLDDWEAAARGAPRDQFATTMPEFPAFGLNVWSPRPAPRLDITVMRAAGAMRAMSAFIGNAQIVNKIIGTLRRDGDFPMPPAPTNHPQGWPAYATIFRDLDALTSTSSDEPCALRLPDAYGPEDVARDRALCNLIPDLSSGTPNLSDILVAVEFLRSTWPVMVDQGRGRFLLLNLQGLTHQQWQEDSAWSLHRGLAALRGLPVPLWFLQLSDQQLSDWELPGDPPILTEHVDAQFGWMLEAHPDPAAWRAQYPDDSGLEVSPTLRKLHQPQ